MAGGKLSARQKMINLMYLVFIAMMAMNMSKEVLNAFKIFDTKFEKSNATLSTQNQSALLDLTTKAGEQPKKYGPLLEQAKKVKAVSDKFYSYLGSMKDSVTVGVDIESYAKLDNSKTLDQMWFTGDRYTTSGDEFIAAVDEYKAGMAEALLPNFSDANNAVQENFQIEPVVNSEGKELPWLKYNFEGYPLAASLTRFTQMQNDVKSNEQDVYSALLQGQLSEEVSMRNYQALVVPEKSAFFAGENFKGKVVLGRYDNTLSFEKVIINGKEVKQTEAGQVTLDFPAGNVGEREIKGELHFKEGDSVVIIPVKGDYAVINQPNSATISADKMNVVYRGVENPMTISFAGVPSSTVKATAPGLRQVSGTNYMMKPSDGREVTINVSGVINGKTVSDKKMFRIKGIPKPIGTIRSQDGIVKMQREALGISTIGADLPDFDFDLKLNVVSFKFNVPGQPTVQVNGNKLNAQAKGVLNRAKRGETVQIFDITAKISGNSSYRLPTVTPVFIELTN